MVNGSLYDLLLDSTHPSYQTDINQVSTLKFILQAARGVLSLHQLSIIHRDLGFLKSSYFVGFLCSLQEPSSG